MMDAFDLIALALWCQVAQQVPWGRGWGWLTAKALALRSAVWPEAYSAPVIDADDIDWVAYDEPPAVPRRPRRKPKAKK